MARKRFVRSPAPRRLTTWGFLVPTTVALSASGANLVLSLNAAALALRPFTIVRTHLELALRSDQSAAIEIQSIAYGMAVVLVQAVAIGVSAVPTPATDSGSDLWFLHGFMNADESDLTDRTRSGTFRTVSSKAMRKVAEGEDMILTLESTGLGSGANVDVMGRFLVKTN